MSFKDLLSWDWYLDADAMRVFVHLLLKASPEPENVRGVELLRGQYLTSTRRLSMELDMSTQQIRTALRKLQSTHELTSKTTNKYTVISITCYDLYFIANKQTNKQTTHRNIPPKIKKEPEWMEDYIVMFWTAYPKKEDKKKALEMLKKMIIKNPDIDYFQAILDRVNIKAKVTAKPFWPSPVRYLRDEKWNDDIIGYSDSPPKNSNLTKSRTIKEQLEDTSWLN